MSLSNPDTVVTEQRLSDFYQAILPYIGGIEIADGFSSTDTRPLQNQVITKLFAENFDASRPYSEGDWVIYGGKLYECDNNHSGAWDSNDFNEITMSWIINQLEVNKIDTWNLADLFSTSNNYTIGDYVIYNSNSNEPPNLYICTTTHSAGTFDPSHFTLIDITTVLKQLLIDLAPKFSTTASYVIGDYVSYNNYIYRFTSNHSAGAWASGDVTLVNIGSELKSLNSAIASKPNSLADLSDITLSLPLVDGQILEYDANNSRWINAENVHSFATYGGSLTFSNLTSSLLVAANEDKFYLCTDGGTIASADASNWILSVGSVIPPNSHIAVVNTGTSANPVYKFDDFGGYVDLSGKADKSDLDGWTSPQTATTVGSNVVVEFDDLSNSYGYDLYCEDTLVGIISMTKGTGTNTGIKLTYVLDGATSGVTSCKLRILK